MLFLISQNNHSKQTRQFSFKSNQITTPQYKTQKEKKNLRGAFTKHWVYPTLKQKKNLPQPKKKQKKLKANSTHT